MSRLTKLEIEINELMDYYNVEVLGGPKVEFTIALELLITSTVKEATREIIDELKLDEIVETEKENI